MIKNILIITFLIGILDSIYLSLFKNKFNTMIKNIQGSDINLHLLSAISCYILLIISIYYFVIKKNFTYPETFLLGFIIYGVFDFTNLAIFRKWQIDLAIIDMIWGGILFTSTYYLYNKLI